MATKPPKSGVFRDPFSKWEDGSTRVVSQLLKNAADEKVALTKATNRVQALRSSLSTLSGAEAQIAKRLLNEALKELAATQKAQRKSTINSNNLTALQVDTANKLSALRSWMEGQTLNPAEKRKAEYMKKLMEKVMVDLSHSNLKDVDFKKIEQTVKIIEEQQAAMPEDLSARFAASEEALLAIQKRQDEARKFLEEHKKMLGQFGSRILQSVAGLTMRLADRVGVGPFTLGNALRGAGLIGRGLIGAGRFGMRVARGETYVQRYLAAKKQVQGAEEGEGLGSKLIDTIKKLGASNAWFQRKLLRELEKQGRDKKEGGGVLGKLGLMMSNIMGSISKFFGAGGFLKTISTIGKWLAPLAGAARFLLTRAMPVVGAFLGGWKVGSMIYEKYAVQIQDAIDSTIGALKSAYDWVATKIGGVKDWAVGAYNKGKDMIVGGAKALYGKALGAAETVGTAVTSAAGKISDFAVTTGRTIAESAPVQTAKSAVTGAYTAGQAAGSYISQGVTKLSDLVGKVITKGPNANIDDLTPGIQSSVGAMAQEYFAATGKKLQINSGMRDHAEQERLFKSMPAGMAARPGSSLHNYGMALDVQSAQAAELQKLGLLDKYGFTRPIKNEPWHMQPKGISVAAAKAGIYSADAPNNQTQNMATARPAAQAAPAASVSGSSGASIGSNRGPQAMGGQRQIVGAKPVGLNDIPTLDMSDGLFTALNLGVL